MKWVSMVVGVLCGVFPAATNAQGPCCERLYAESGWEPDVGTAWADARSRLHDALRVRISAHLPALDQSIVTDQRLSSWLASPHAQIHQHVERRERAYGILSRVRFEVELTPDAVITWLAEAAEHSEREQHVRWAKLSVSLLLLVSTVVGARVADIKSLGYHRKWVVAIGTGIALVAILWVWRI